MELMSMMVARVCGVSPGMRHKQRGQGMTEYIIIVALIAIAAIGTFRLFGDTARNQVAAMAKELSGEDGTEARGAAAQSSEDAADEAVRQRDLSNFTGNNPGAGS